MPDLAPQAAPSDRDVMSAFLETHKAPPVEKSAPVAKATPAPLPEGPNDADDGDEGGDLDVTTLQALGLVDEERQPGASRDDDGEEDDAGTAHPVDLTALAKALGVNPDDLSLDKDKGVTVKTKVDGKAAEVSLDELRKGYQLQQHFTRQQEQFLAERQQWEQARQQQEGQLEQQAQLAMSVLQSEEQQLQQAYTLDWAALRRDDPAEYAAMVAEYNQRLTALKGRQQALVGSYQQRMQEHQQARQKQRGELFQRETQALADALSWKDAETRKSGADRLQAYLLREQGFSEKDLASITDHRAFILADKARRYDELMKKVDTARKKVSTAPTMPAENSSPKPKAATSRKKVDSAMNRLRRDHSTEAAAEVFKHLKVV